ncbi:MAG: ATP-grasp domain-containing protein [Candidatus Omnitrophota bacterium]
MKITLTYNLKKDEEGRPADFCSEYDAPETIDAIKGALETKGHNVALLEVTSTNLLSYFKKHSVDFVFNIAEGTRSSCRESEIPALLSLLNIPHTGSSHLSLALAMNKATTKKILKYENIPTPEFQLFQKGTEALKTGLKFPLIVKPNCEGSSKGICKSSMVGNENELYAQIRRVIDEYRCEALVEEFIDGKEVTVGILENGKITILPILEIDFSSCKKSGEFFYSWRMKEFQGNSDLGLTPTFYCPARLDNNTKKEIEALAVRAHRALGCRDISRTDIRLNHDGKPYVLEVNPLPGLDPIESIFPKMARAAGLDYPDLIEAILLNASERRIAS